MPKFVQALIKPKKGLLGIIAEIKLASPTEKFLGKEEEIVNRVRQYEKAGASAISVVTEKNIFKGDPKFVTQIKSVTSLPVLQKDFIYDISKIQEAKSLGADAILLIAKILSKADLISLVSFAFKIGIEPVVEINNENELKKALATKTSVIAVNARNLETLTVDVDKACELLKKIPKKFIKLGFSGVKSKAEVAKYQQAGAQAILIGTNLMKAKNVAKFFEGLKTINVKVKICGIRTLEAAQTAISYGADFLGFNFVAASKRYISPSDAAEIIIKLKGKARTVGVFQNADIEYVNRVSANLGLDMVQLHGSEDNQYIANVKMPVIKVMTINDNPKKYSASYLMIDRPNRTGAIVNLKKSAQIAKSFPIFFAGGLTDNNVEKVISVVKPFAVDVAGGIETDGTQDVKKIKNFIENVRRII